MPVRVPEYVLPPLPPLGATPSLTGFRQSLVDWHQRLQDTLFRNWKHLELVPTLSFATSTAAVSLTTATTGSTVPGLRIVTPVPAGAVVHVQTVLDVRTDAGINIFGELRVTYPNAHTSVQPAQVIMFSGSGFQRATLPQQWHFIDPIPGDWTFEMLGRKEPGAGASTATIQDIHSNLLVEVT